MSDHRKTNTKSLPVISDGAFRSPVGPTVGWADDDVSNTPLYVDLSNYAGLLIEIDVDEDMYVCFVPNTSTTPTRGTAEPLSSGLIDSTAYVYAKVTTSLPRQWVVPYSDPVLCYRTVAASGTGDIHVRRA